MREFRFGPKVFQFDVHSRWNTGSEMCIAFNVKFHAWPLCLPRTYEKKARILEAVGHTKYALLEAWAWEDMQTDWWQTVEREAKDRWLGSVFSAGRSGGWLVLDAYTMSKLDNLIYEYERQCEHCKLEWSRHGAGGKCLFESTTWKSSDESGVETMKEIQKFGEYIKEALNWVKDEYIQQWMNVIDQRWDDYREEYKKRKEDECQPQSSCA